MAWPPERIQRPVSIKVHLLCLPGCRSSHRSLRLRHFWPAGICLIPADCSRTEYTTRALNFPGIQKFVHPWFISLPKCARYTHPPRLTHRRQRLETVIGQLVEQFHTTKVWASIVWQLASRWMRKLLRHSIVVLICCPVGIPPFSQAKIAGHFACMVFKCPR